jgi:cytochrome c oxidase subunit 2
LASVSGLLGLLPQAAFARNPFEFQTPVTPIAEETLFIHNLFLIIIAIIFTLSILVLGYTLFVHRKSRGHQSATFIKPTGVKQWIFTLIPFLVLIFIDYVILGIPAFNSILALANTSHADMTIKVTGSQWKWEYEYPKEGIKFLSTLSTPQDQIENKAPPDKHFLLEVDHPLVLPTNEKIRIVLASRDVIHAFWVPAFGIKQDVVPGYLRDTWVKITKPGTYRGQCGELCGVGHAFMPIVVVAKPKAEYEKWVVAEQARENKVKAASSQTFSKEDLLAKGKKVFMANCASCHQANGLGIPGAFPPLVDGKPFSAAKTMTDDLVARKFYKDGKIVLGPVDNHIGIVLHGITGTAMPAFGPQLSDLDIAAVITYERNDFGNHTGDVVEPSQVKTDRAKK